MTQEQQQQGFYEYNGNTYFKDKFGSWYVKSSGYESLYLSGIKDDGLLNAVHYELNTKPDAKINFQHDGKWYTIWNNQDSTQIKVDRKGEHSNNDNATYDTTEETKAEANASKGAQAMAASKPNTGGFKSFGGNSGGDGKSKYYVDEIKLVIMTPEEFEKGLKFEAMWNIAEKATENVKLVQDKEGNVKYHIILQHKKAF